MVAAIGGWVVAAILAITGYRERRENQRHMVLLQALEYLTGGSQKRSIGIALIEGLWERGHPFHRSLLPALINQAVYLLLETESREGRHQFQNWCRIMELIFHAPYVPNLKTHYYELSNALYQHIDDTITLERGIVVSKELADEQFRRLVEHADL
jgi:hypothetical protein